MNLKAKEALSKWGWHLAAIFVVWSATRLFTLSWGLPNRISFAPDAVPLTAETNAREMMERNTYKYPPLQYMIWNALHPPVSARGRTPEQRMTLVSRRLASFRLVVAFMTLGTALALFVMCLLCFGMGHWSLLPPVVFLLNPTSLYYSHTTNMEQPYLFWFVLSWLVLLGLPRVMKTERTAPAAAVHLLFGVLMGCAFCTKDQVYALYALPLIACACYLFRKEGPKRAMLACSCWTVAFAATTAAIYWSVGGWEAWRNHTGWIVGQGVEGFRQADGSLLGRLWLVVRSCGDAARALDWPLTALSIAAMLRFVRTRPAEPSLRRLPLFMLIGLLSFHVLFVQVTRFGYPRFYLPFVPFAAVLGAWLLQSVEKDWRKCGRAGVAVVLVLLASIGAQTLRSLVADSRVRLRRRIEAMEREAPGPMRIGLDGCRLGHQYNISGGTVKKVVAIRKWTYVNYGQLSKEQSHMILHPPRFAPLCLAVVRPEMVIVHERDRAKDDVLRDSGFDLVESVLRTGNFIPSLFARPRPMPEFSIYIKRREGRGLSRDEIDCTLEEQLLLLNACFLYPDRVAQLRAFGALCAEFSDLDTVSYGIPHRAPLLGYAAYRAAGRTESIGKIIIFLRSRGYTADEIRGAEALAPPRSDVRGE